MAAERHLLDQYFKPSHAESEFKDTLENNASGLSKESNRMGQDIASTYRISDTPSTSTPATPKNPFLQKEAFEDSYRSFFFAKTVIGRFSTNWLFFPFLKVGKSQLKKYDKCSTKCP